ncbi:MAG: hypothetical protein HYY43_03435 [Deltaproteobacteria bacterium]|nr:hypothetical protein [Deltaproteobacteria bacterium]MBI2341868.1 hypothetical protein [Deltaproteobacteria bacterium]MBI2974621.1 hypothetical protein [Deltaproteobacteria bacterium]
MSKSGILDNVLLVESWCAYFYKQYFSKIEYNPVIKTRDIDFLVNVRPTFSKSVDLEELLKPIGFEIEFFGSGYMKLESEELAIEFLVPEIGRPSEKPMPLPALKLNAQPLRHLDILWRNPIKVAVSGIFIRLPHPVDYLLQKLVIAGRRKKADKSEKDRQSALAVLDAVIDNDELQEFHKAVKYLSKKELKTVTEELSRAGREDVLA